jgi:hypothetical protein
MIYAYDYLWVILKAKTEVLGEKPKYLEENGSTRRKAEVLRGKPKYSEAKRSTRRKTEVLIGKPKYSEEKRSAWRKSEVLRGKLALALLYSCHRTGLAVRG